MNFSRASGHLASAVLLYLSLAVVTGCSILSAPSYVRGNEYYEAGNYDAAIVAYREAIAISPSDPYYHLCLGNALVAKGDIAGGIGAYREAVLVSPTNERSFFRVSLSMALQKAKGDTSGAIAEGRRAISDDPNSILAHVNLAQLFEASGDRTAAIAEYREACGADPTLQSSRGSIEKLKTLRDLACREK